MHTNNAVRHKKNKHGRKGVRKTVSAPPTLNEVAQSFRKGWKDGYYAGNKDGVRAALIVAKEARTIKAARSAIEAML